MVGVDRFWKGFEEGYDIAREGVLYAAEMAEGASTRAGIRLKVFTKKRQIERTYGVLGKVVYALYKGKKENVMAAPKVKSTLKEIESLEREIIKLLEKIEKEGSKPAAGKRTAKAAKKAKKAK